jgi:hypothetical protein
MRRGRGLHMMPPEFSRMLRMYHAAKEERMIVTVQSYAGYKGGERPVSFSREGGILRIIEIVDRWYDPDSNIFKVRTDDGKTYLLRHDMNADGWELEESPS